MSKVTISAVIKRINRRLRHEGEMLRTLRGFSGENDLGRYYIVSDNNCLVAPHQEPEQLARELGVLASHESVVGE